ncbi:MAG TPA: hypothetical protein VHD34_06410 [Xanthobacteraceae bacterium]|nr:hypothetical protein [Xanthobacteraceae bacterium]
MAKIENVPAIKRRKRKARFIESPICNGESLGQRFRLPPVQSGRPERNKIARPQIILRFLLHSTKAGIVRKGFSRFPHSSVARRVIPVPCGAVLSG